MRNIPLRIVLLAILLTLSTYAIAAPAPQQDATHLDSMTVGELEKTGDLARAQKDYDLAIQCFETALQKDRKNAVLYNKLGLAELKSNDLRSARAHFEKASKLNSKYVEPVNNVGAVEYMKKNYGGAAKYFKKGVAPQRAPPTDRKSKRLHS